MPRARTAELLKQAYEVGDRDAALALLEQSMALGHRRIALLRYLQARHLHATLEARHHDYVRDVVPPGRRSPLARGTRYPRSVSHLANLKKSPLAADIRGSRRASLY
jgi:hypothetical protein